MGWYWDTVIVYFGVVLIYYDYSEVFWVVLTYCGYNGVLWNGADLL